MSDEIREKKYKFESSIKLPDMQEILDAASDFTPPSDKPVEVAATPEPEKEKKQEVIDDDPFGIGGGADDPFAAEGEEEDSLF